MSHLTLREAILSDRLQEFVAQEEARSVPPVSERELMEAIKATIKPRRSADRTSRSPSRGGSTGK